MVPFGDSLELCLELVPFIAGVFYLYLLVYVCVGCSRFFNCKTRRLL